MSLYARNRIDGIEIRRMYQVHDNISHDNTSYERHVIEINIQQESVYQR